MAVFGQPSFFRQVTVRWSIPGAIALPRSLEAMRWSALKRPYGARGRTRTGKGVNPADFKSAAFTISPPGRGPRRVYVSIVH